MTGNKNTLERKLQENNESESKVSMDTNLYDFGSILRQERRTGKNKGMAFHLARCMVGYLHQGGYPGMGYTKLKPLNTIREIYSFAERKDLPSLGHYGKKTWLKLNECLEGYGLPPLNLPKEWNDF